MWDCDWFCVARVGTVGREGLGTVSIDGVVASDRTFDVWDCDWV